VRVLQQVVAYEEQELSALQAFATEERATLVAQTAELQAQLAAERTAHAGMDAGTLLVFIIHICTVLRGTAVHSTQGAACYWSFMSTEAVTALASATSQVGSLEEELRAAKKEVCVRVGNRGAGGLIPDSAPGRMCAAYHHSSLAALVYEGRRVALHMLCSQHLCMVCILHDNAHA
jgi:hypothetical protein